MKKTPMRMCVICKGKYDKRSLFRLIHTSEGEVTFDATGKKNGRGAYICASEDCLDLVKNRKKLANALEFEVSQDQLSAISEEIRNHLLTKK
jgi:predicted RNA-binding protein YlxR (DUF448 family)